MPEQPLTLNAGTAKLRLDKFLLAHLPGYSRAQVQRLIREGFALVDGSPRKTGYRFKGGEVVTLRLPEPQASTIEPENIPLHILHEDACLAVIDKPAGMVVQPGPSHPGGTLVNALLWRYPELAKMRDDPATSQRLGIAHRLDRGTSGLLLVARDKPTLLELMAQFQARAVEKKYLALLERRPSSNAGLIDAPIARDQRQRKRMAVQRGGKSAQTEFEVLDDHFQGERAFARLKLLTGRTHQIRVHMAFIGCPVVGDAVYGYRKQRLKMKRLFLHAHELAFEHPDTGERLRFVSELPVGLRNVLEKLR
ncbi:MAG: RluA family pseudouridine synthase [Chloroflexi bacterium]|nr:RluA family pseudouridine synthase [Chloroflexota bacterium]MCY3581214.1 RluA family pseudouridine synthase [Chloroflexota bacterium]MCY3716516.1 RluA family pseudouridine synthase [Chloroflexota bacterium]MDE2649808.1 RluA family pseudouridine synthase [Chloroflexota bacterium]MXX51008.1 RluA family pseudouridine synthase [Chloroflexota bacterium]